MKTITDCGERNHKRWRKQRFFSPTQCKNNQNTTPRFPTITKLKNTKALPVYFNFTNVLPWSQRFFLIFLRMRWFSHLISSQNQEKPLGPGYERPVCIKVTCNYTKIRFNLFALYFSTLFWQGKQHAETLYFNTLVRFA